MLGLLLATVSGVLDGDTLFWKTQEGIIGDEDLICQMGNAMNSNVPPMMRVVSTSTEFQSLQSEW
jgi:predicted lipid carrier protein YhbT